MSNVKRQIRQEIRSELKDISPNTIPEISMTDHEYFMLHANQLWYLDKMRGAMVNQTRSSIVESIIQSASNYQKIREMRRDQTIDKKKTAVEIKKASKEQGWTEQMITNERDKLVAIDKTFQAIDIAKIELTKKLKPYLETLPIYTNWLNLIKGISVITASKLIRLIGDIRRFDKPSALWHYSGLHVVNGKAPKMQSGKQATWNPKLRALLIGIMGDNFIKQRSIYRKVYDKRVAKTKKTKPIIWWLNADGTKRKGKNMHPKHGHKDAIRVMMKTFLLDFWIASYQALGLKPPRKPYSSRYHPNKPYKPVFPYK